MDDLNAEPKTVAEDIIKQATGLGFKQEATKRIIDILSSYHKLKNSLKIETIETNVIYERALAWKIVEGQKKEGPYCARCHGKNGELKPMIELQKGLWECTNCGKRFNEHAGEVHITAL